MSSKVMCLLPTSSGFWSYGRKQPALAVPGMVLGTPGMDFGAQKEAYKVILFDKAGKRQVFASR
jgi:hypothetical protein